MKRLLVFQHMAWEGPGQHLINSAKRLGVALDVLEVWHMPIPDIRSYDGLLLLGGGPNVNQEKGYPFLKREKEVICQAIEADMPYLGFCLGHQLLADALGAKVGPNFQRSIGFIHGRLTDDGLRHPVFRGIPRDIIIFKWHSQAVLSPLPEHVNVLVSSSECAVEAISVKGKPYILGLQFDSHAASVADVKRWLKGDQGWLAQSPGVNPEAMMRDAQTHEVHVGQQFEVFFKNYIDLMP
ncbi:MAG: type 1 glutamine amidotransferase [Nitrospiraceae bacterium]|nr:type 1 glutamine amidotransferase [Nitrospiraceae bacterium]